MRVSVFFAAFVLSMAAKAGLGQIQGRRMPKASGMLFAVMLSKC